MAKASSPRLFSALKIGMPLTASAIAPRRRNLRASTGSLESFGTSGTCQAFEPRYA